MTPRALLVEPPYGEPKMEPNGLLYLATWARQHGFAVDVLYESPKTRFSVDEAVARAASGGYDLVGVTAMTPTLPRALAVLRGAKRARPGTLGVMGGYHATVAHRKLLERHPEVDVAVRGEGEQTFLELLGRLAGGVPLDGLAGLSFRDARGRVVENELRPLLRDLDQLPFPDRTLGPGPEEYVHFYDADRGEPQVRANVTSSRGCPYGCAFCVLGSDDPGSPISLRRWRGRSPANVVAEIERLVAAGVGCIAFAEDNFTVSPRRLEEFADLVLARGLAFTFTCDARANQVCRMGHVLPKLRRAGLRKVEMGVESASQAVLDRFAKGTKVAHNVEALRLLRENDILPRIDFLMFDPEATVEDLALNLEFLKRHSPPNYDHNRTVYQKLELHPGTELQRRYLASGFVSGDPDEVIPYEFAVPEVGRLFRVVDRFYWDHQVRLDELKKRMHFLQVLLRKRNDRASLAALARDLVFVALPANALPLRLFESVLRAGEASAFALPELERAAAPFAARVAALEEEFDQAVRRHDLEAAALAAAAPA